ncbi:MAG TPA: hypothetical protein VMQ52_01730 [Candidatus Saccharimonadales bacterium]|jgi:hypothetical protein|nr:hypothetical protein [Candidatus Saccharimonadales bacterium]
MGSKPKQSGRPTVITKTTVLKLEQALKDGFSVERASSLSGISRSTYYAHLQNDTDFMNKMELAQTWATERAKQVVVQAIDKGNLKAAQWWLERKLRAEFSLNPPPFTQGNDDSDFVSQYFDGNQEKFLDFMSQTIEAMRQPAKL